MKNQHYPFTLPALPFAVDALEPYIDHETVEIHHGRHFQTYIDNLNKALEPYPTLHAVPLEQLLAEPNRLPEQVRTAIINNGGGVYNHDFYFHIINHNGSMPKDDLMDALVHSFGSFDGFRDQFKKAALGQFGSGWAWLYSDNTGKLGITSTANQDTLIPLNICPILLIDVWEHAYYLKYKNKRVDYVDAFFSVIDWDNVETLFHQCPACQR